MRISTWLISLSKLGFPVEKSTDYVLIIMFILFWLYYLHDIQMVGQKILNIIYSVILDVYASLKILSNTNFFSRCLINLIFIFHLIKRNVGNITNVEGRENEKS